MNKSRGVVEQDPKYFASYSTGPRHKPSVALCEATPINDDDDDDDELICPVELDLNTAAIRACCQAQPDRR